ncbi:MAG: glycoside hydrolase 43 family protein, partial [Muribaculaceae bacterium]|nr:glycoside hydrolase 43 family protein [Muribaculaceae bacterium]
MLSCGGTRAEAGQFHNPVIWADVPDPDVIRVGDDYYMVSTTMHLMPGCPVMHSKDLVNWQTIGYVFDRLEDTPRYDLIDGTVYGKGQWATSIRWRDGRFYVLFSPNDQPYRSYIYTAENPAGPWELLTRTDHFHDASLLLDDDGKAYVFYNGGPIRLRQLNDDLNGVKPGGIDQIVIMPDSTETGLHEGSRVIKHDGRYYAFVISWPAGKPRRQLCYVADSITGPYTKHVVLESEFGGFPYVGQGCLVDDTEGNFWGMIFQDRGGVGRVLTLNPCRFVDGVPMLGDADGKVPAVVTKTLDADGVCRVSESDDFADGKMSVLWQWNHNPVDSAWSLTENPGYLRLKTARVVSNIFEAPNTISQRMEGPGGSAVVKFVTSGMKPGDVAGFAAFNGDSGLLAVEADNDGKYIVCGTASVELGDGHKVTNVYADEWARVPFEADTVYFKIDTDFNPGRDIATFSYSLDGDVWTT